MQYFSNTKGLLQLPLAKQIWTCAFSHLQAQQQNVLQELEKQQHPVMLVWSWAKKITEIKHGEIVLSQWTSFQKHSLKDTYAATPRELSFRDTSSCHMLSVTDISQGEKYLKPHSVIRVLHKLSTNRRPIFAGLRDSHWRTTCRNIFFFYFDTERSVVPLLKHWILCCQKCSSQLTITGYPS